MKMLVIIAVDEEYRYAREDLWQYINGAADLFLSYGFRELIVRDLEQGDRHVTVSVYDMGGPLDAFGVYERERPDDGRLPGTVAVAGRAFLGLEDLASCVHATYTLAASRSFMSLDRIDAILADLEHWFAACPSAVIAFSGGVDSSLVAYLARRYLGRDRCLAVVGDSPSLKRRDLDGAVTFAARHDIPLRVITTTELDHPTYRANPEDRCFHCKSVLFEQLGKVRRELGFGRILGGENADDHGDYRPGLRAAARFEVRGPLAECGVTKVELREVARRLGLECWEKPASPCLSSRIPYYSEITGVKLGQIEAGEAWLEQRGFPVSRVRHHATHARVEVPVDRVAELEAMSDDVAPAFADLGFATVEIDPEGFVSGKLNRALD